MSLKTELVKIAIEAQAAARAMQDIPSNIKNAALTDMARALEDNLNFLIRENKRDIQKAKSKGLPSAFIDRLTLNEKRIKEMSGVLLDVCRLNDPTGEVIKAWRRPNGLWIHKVRTPLGVIVIIYESRPNVTAECIGLCFKSGNAVILRGGSEAINSNLAIYNILKGVLKTHKIPEGLIQMVATADRRAIDELLKLTGYIDLVIPRGGEGLINKVSRLSRIPVIKHYKGICHVYVDEWADLNMAEQICFNAKVGRPGVCNAMECMLVHGQVAARFLPGMLKKFRDAGVQIRGCKITQKIAKYVLKATDKDYHTEYLDLILSVKVVKSLEEAISHINHFGSHHSDSIVTHDYESSMRFLRQVDSACVYVNASTRFTDGNQFGMGAEIGISTDKLHARGPMALEELTTYKYMIFGNGQIRT